MSTHTDTSLHPSATDECSAKIERVNGAHTDGDGEKLPGLDLRIGTSQVYAFLTEEQLADILRGLAVDAVSEMVPALAWWYDQVYDGPESVRPEWVTDAEETLGEKLVPGGNLEDRTNAVELALYRFNEGDAKEGTGIVHAEPLSPIEQAEIAASRADQEGA